MKQSLINSPYRPSTDLQGGASERLHHVEDDSGELGEPESAHTYLGTLLVTVTGACAYCNGWGVVLGGNEGMGGKEIRWR